MSKDTSNSTKGYIPPDAEINYSNTNNEPPKTEYERRRKHLRRKEVKNLTKGKYGKNDNI